MRTNQTKVVSIGIVTYNSEDYVIPCLRSVFEQTWSSFEVVVLDNCSIDGTVERIRQNYPDVQLFLNSRNTGFSRGHNRLIAETNGGYYMPLNPDVVLTPNYVQEMIKALEREPEIGWVCGKLLFLSKAGEQTDRIYSTGHKIYRNGIIGNIGYGEHDNGQYEQAQEVFGANGAAPLYRRAMLEDIRVGAEEYFDEMFFMYGSDPELDWRARILGWHCWYTPIAIGYHVASASGGLTDPWIQLDYIRRRYIMVLKCADWHDLLCYYIPMLLGDMLLAVRYRSKKTARAILGVVSYLPGIIRRRHTMMVRRRSKRAHICPWFQASRMHVLQ